MKKMLRHAVVLLLFATFNIHGSTLFAQGSAFTYQGRLTLGTNPATGFFDLTFTLNSASSGGTVLAGPVTNLAVPVASGLFTTPVNFGAGVFVGGTDWLAIGVRTNGTTVAFTALTPLTQVTPTPYAIFAEGANAAGLSGTIPPADLSGTYGSAVTLANPGNSFTGNGSGLANVNAGLLGGLAPSNFWQTAGNAGTSPGVNYLGTSDNEPLLLRANGEDGLQLQYAFESTPPPLITSQASINLIGGYWGNTIASGVIGGTIAGGGDSSRLGAEFFNSPNTVTGSYGTVGGGTGNTAGYSSTVPGGNGNAASGEYSFAAGLEAQALNQGAFVWADSQGAVFASTANDQFLIRAQGGVGIGTDSPEQALSVYGGMNLDQASQNEGVLNNGNTNGYGLTFGIDAGEGIASQRTGGSPASGQYGLEFYTDFAKRMTILQDGNVGVGTNSPIAALEVASGGNLSSPQLLLVQENNDYSRLRFAPYSYSTWDIAAKTVMNFYVNGANVMTLTTNGNLTINSLTIAAGSDLAEPFALSAADQEISQGSVVIIDEAHPGQLKLSDQPYDTRVAGVISGANGIHPGIQMQQLGMSEGAKNVALTGRVYVWADAANGSIKPGDMLTTSSTPGCAMKVTDHARAQGAILGKAMTGLSAGKGMVLVLVTLQ